MFSSFRSRLQNTRDSRFGVCAGVADAYGSSFVNEVLSYVVEEP